MTNFFIDNFSSESEITKNQEKNDEKLHEAFKWYLSILFHVDFLLFYSNIAPQFVFFFR